ncbi:NAD-dependent epimerase/dehydratase family protein [Acidisphaera sp. S103]|uniref:NAD-dependent epimerase/dehydratase family protein n=1 Tax=Acidisphaera sp. S103 TaxID=1747223 RepID=UPI00131B915A|nr:NAD-dependent epimerase/dehydratase family protein [Acidisphaera sp. S103]
MADYRKILVTGGAGFVGSNLALNWKRHTPNTEIIALDNLKRRGSELALPRLRAGGVTFHHGDVRSPEDLDAIGPVDLMIECSAEPSVHAGYGQSPAYLVNTNLTGLINCLDHLRRTGGDLVFLSSSRVYPIAALRALKLHQQQDRLTLTEDGQGWSAAGIAETFPLTGARSLYGATKLAAELLIEEYRAMYGLKAVINRCGVLAGPWQMGKVDQGFVVLWMARHLFGGPLSYSGFGGQGIQVRDILHVDDLFDLLRLQTTNWPAMDGATFNVGGGQAVSVSLRELTRHCAALTGRALDIGQDPETRPADIPWYVSDSRTITQATGWRPTRDVATILTDIHRWLVAERTQLEPILRA